MVKTMNAKDLIFCANRAEELRKSLHSEKKICKYDCKEYRMGILTVLCNLGFITDPDESLNIVNSAGYWDKQLRSKEN